MKKLIRDKIPEIIKAAGHTPKVSVLNEKEFKKALKIKLIEEAKELNEAKTKDEILNELSDVLELIENIAKNNNLTMAAVEKNMKKKRIERGGFNKRLFLENVKN